MRSLKQLQTLDFCGVGPNLQLPTFDKVAPIISSLPNLQSFSAHLLVSRNRTDTFAAIESANLRSLYLQYITAGQLFDGTSLTSPEKWKMPKLKTFFLAGIGAVLWPDDAQRAWPPTLRKIHCTFNLRTGHQVLVGALIHPYAPDHLQHFYYRCIDEMPTTRSGNYPPLETLIVHHLRSFETPIAEDPCWNSSLGAILRRLEFNYCETDSESLQYILRRFPRLLWLSFSHAKFVDDDVLDCVGKTCQSLTTLDLGGCNRIQSASVLRLVKLQPSLKRLIIDKDILAPDVLKWLRKTRRVLVTQLANA